MEIEKLDRSGMDHTKMDIIDEYEIPLDVDPEEINRNLVVAAKYLQAISAVNKKRQILKEQKKTVLDWFSEQQDKLDKQDEYLQSVIDSALYKARQNGEAKPKIKTWAGSAYYTKRTKIDWNGLTNTSNELIRVAKNHNLDIEVIEKTSLSELKKHITEKEMKELGIKEIQTESLTIRKS